MIAPQTSVRSRSLLQRIRALFDRIFGTLLFRKLYHFFFGFVYLFSLVVFDKTFYLIGILVYLVIFWFVGKRISLAALGIMILYAVTNSKFSTLGAGIVFVVGDGTAALIGSRFGLRKWPWHAQKTVVGSTAFLCSSTIAMLIFLTIALPGHTQDLFLLALLPSLAGCIFECLPVLLINGHKVMLGKSHLFDDNLVVILASGMVLNYLTAWLGIQVSLT